MEGQSGRSERPVAIQSGRLDLDKRRQRRQSNRRLWNSGRCFCHQCSWCALEFRRLDRRRRKSLAVWRTRVRLDRQWFFERSLGFYWWPMGLGQGSCLRQPSGHLWYDNPRPYYLPICGQRPRDSHCPWLLDRPIQSILDVRRRRVRFGRNQRQRPTQRPVEIPTLPKLPLPELRVIFGSQLLIWNC